MAQSKVPPARPVPPSGSVGIAPMAPTVPQSPHGARTASTAPRAPQAPLPPSVPPGALSSPSVPSVDSLVGGPASGGEVAKAPSSPPESQVRPSNSFRAAAPVATHEGAAHHPAVSPNPTIPDIGLDGSFQTYRQLSETVAVPRISLAIEREGGMPVQRTIVHAGDVCKIGSHASNDIVLRDPMVSRFHCRLVREEGVWRLRDSGSMNGTKLDGVRVRDADIMEGGALTLGDSVVRLRAGEGHKEDHVPILPSFGALVGTSLPMRRMFGLLDKIAQSDINVLIEGESGTGKEVVATEIMQRSARAEKPFVVVDCGAISPSLVESELFGHVRGAFTGADRDRMGAFEAADGGTVFLDEIGELPLELQPKLLRALEAREIRRVGETKARRVNVRVISATNRDLEREVNKGRFREDLYFRLAVISARVPPLRERIDDLMILVRTFLNQLGVPEEEKLFPPQVIAEMSKHDWPGNVRELRNYVERSVVLQSASPTLRRGKVPSSPMTQGQTATPIDPLVPFRIAKDTVIDQFERGYLAQLLEQSSGNMSKAARMAGMDRMYLHRLVQKHGLRGGNSGGPSSRGGGGPPSEHPSIRPNALLRD